MSAPHSPTPDWAISCMKRIVKFDDPDLLEAVLDLVVGVSGLNDNKRSDPSHSAQRDDAARAALYFGYGQTEDCNKHAEDYLGISV